MIAYVTRSGDLAYHDGVQHRSPAQVRRIADQLHARRPPVRLEHDGPIVGHVDSAWVTTRGNIAFAVADLVLDQRGHAAVADGYRECSLSSLLHLDGAEQVIHEVCDVALVRVGRAGHYCRVLAPPTPWRPHAW